MLLQTKFHIPTARTALVTRPRLLGKLGLGRSGQVTLIAAPAGFGKTTLVAEWLRSLDVDTAIAWLSLQQSDNDPSQFWAYATGAIYKAMGQSRGALPPNRQSVERPTPHDLIIALLNELAAQQRSVIMALDDYHLIENAQIHEALQFLLEQMPPQLHLVLITRADPPLPLARLRAQRAINEVRAADLRFSAAEAAAFLNQVMGLDLSAQQVAALEERTEGWVASLQLAALSLQNVRDPDRFIAAFDGGHRHILDYLTEEALQHQPPDVRDFLLKTSILDRMSAPLCDLLTSRSDSQTILARLEQVNLFLIPLDEHRHWYRYHHLFADMLRKLLHAAVGDGGLTQLHSQAARWFAEQEQMDDAIYHALTGRDYVLAVELIAAAELAAENRGNFYTLLSWYEALPESELRFRPKFTIRYAHKVMMMKPAEATDAILDSPWLADLTDPELLGEIAVLRGFAAWLRGDMDRIAQYAQEAQKLLPNTNDFYGGIFSLQGYFEMGQGNLEAAITALQRAAAWNRDAGRTGGAVDNYSTLAYIYGQLGKTADAAAAMDACLQLVEGTAWAREGDVNVEIAGTYAMRGDFAQAEIYLRKALPIFQQAGNSRGERMTLLFFVLLRRLQRDYEAAMLLLRQAQQLRVTADDWWGDRCLVMREAELAWAMGDSGPMRNWLQTERAWPDNFAIDYKATCCQFQILVAANGPKSSLPDQLFTDLEALIVDAEKRNNVSFHTYLLTLQALAELHRGKRAQAYTHLQAAFDLAEPSEHLLCFLEHGAPMETLLEQAITDGVGGEFAQRLLHLSRQLRQNARQNTTSQTIAALPGVSAATSQPTITPRPDAVRAALIEPLTERERQVLDLIASGHTNQEIADKLVISVATVKRHISNLYGKLGVQNRTQAVARARSLQLT